MNEQVSGEQVIVSRDGAMGIIALNRPRAINALNHAMVEAIHSQLDAWAKDDEVRAVLIESTSERGFCSGGDVRDVRQRVLSGETDWVPEFFADEYAMNGAISLYQKPIVALMQGVVMGGGIGIGGHAGVRIAGRNAQFAMPESGIGLMCDVGANALLARVEAHRALAFLLPGLAVGAADAIALNLADHVVEEADFARLRADIVSAVNAGDGPVDLHQVVDPYRIGDAGDPELVPKADTIADCFDHAGAAAIVDALQEKADDDAFARELSEVLAKRCPFSMEVIVREYRAAERDPRIEAVLANDLRLAPMLVQRPDFAEGVRAVLVDKDQAPIWNPARLEDVDVERISRLIE